MFMCRLNDVFVFVHRWIYIHFMFFPTTSVKKIIFFVKTKLIISD